MRFLVMLVVCLTSLLCVEACQAQCEGGSCRTGFNFRPARTVYRLREVRKSEPAPTRFRFFDGDGRPFRKAD